MQATLSAVALKRTPSTHSPPRYRLIQREAFIRALTCLSRYGDDLVLYADAQHFTLSATNSSLSAYCRFRYGRMFFSRYRIGGGVNGAALSASSSSEPQDVKGQLLVKTLLSIFKHRTIEKTVERCELVVVEGPSSDQLQEDEDTLESRLIVRLHCKHGIVKTHRLPLLIPTSLLSPGVPESENESRLTIGPRAVKDITEHFPSGRGIKNDPQLVWTFGDTDVDVKSLESSIDTKGRAQLATELTISADEFDVYEIADPPITIAFHLREFNATIAFAESMASALELRFTDPAAPLFIDIEGDESDSLFVISTSQLQGTSNMNTRNSSTPNPQQLGGQKRPYPDNEAQQSSSASGLGRGRNETPRVEKVKKPMKAVQRMGVPGATSISRENSTATKDEYIMPPPSFIPKPNRTQGSHSHSFHASQDGDFGAMDHFGSGGVGNEAGTIDDDTKGGARCDFSHSGEPIFYPQLSQVVPSPVPSTCERPTQTQRAKIPLFLPLSQLSQEDNQAVRESGLGVEYMNRDELEAMLEGDGEEVEFDTMKIMGLEADEGGDGEGSLDLFEDEFGPTQDADKDGRKAFQPLFED